MFEACKVNQYYGESHTLWDLNMTVPKGQCTVLMGRNGVGKTTFLNVIMGLLPTHSGELIFDGVSITTQPAYQRAHQGIAYVPQGRDIFAQMTVEENLQIGLSARKQPVNKIPELVYELFPVLKEMLKRRGGDLSGGQQQQLAIARALTLQPRLLLLDEPTEGIQPNIVNHIGDVIKRLVQQENITVLLVEQKLPFAKRVGDYFSLLDRGRSVANGNMTDLSENLVQKYLTV